MNRNNLSVVLQAINLAADTNQVRQNVLWIGMAGIALLSAPSTPVGWTLFWLVVATVCVAFSLTNLHQARKLEDPRTSLTHLTITFVTGSIAVIATLAIRPIAGMFLLAIIFLLATTSDNRPFVTAIVSVIAAPWWIWLAADSWRWQLLVLVPLVGLGAIASSHLVDSYVWPRDEEQVLSARGHRAAAWVLIALSGLILIAVGLLTGVSKPWLALGGIVLAISIPIEAGVDAEDSGTAIPGVRVVTGSYLIAIASWLIGIV